VTRQKKELRLLFGLFYAASDDPIFFLLPRAANPGLFFLPGCTLTNSLTRVNSYDICDSMSPGLYTTAEAARAAGVTRATLQAWLATGRIQGPPLTVRRGRAVRLWTASEITWMKQLKGKVLRKGRGRKPKPKPKR
jgi:hypothetical protein